MQSPLWEEGMALALIALAFWAVIVAALAPYHFKLTYLWGKNRRLGRHSHYQCEAGADEWGHMAMTGSLFLVTTLGAGLLFGIFWALIAFTVSLFLSVMTWFMGYHGAASRSLKA